jgi:hypothetical protein
MSKPIFFIDCGGPMRKIEVGGKIIEFEMHHFCGPNILNKQTGSPLANQPLDFLRAVSLWCQQGRKIDERGICIWYDSSPAHFASPASTSKNH